jgi:glycosyltransferase involved in cell wall biosynthesis
MRIALIGTRGVPARYGGFETCVEEVGSRLAAAGHAVTVYCRRTPDHPVLSTHRGMRLITLPALRRRSLETLSHTFTSVAHVVAHERPDAALLFNAANAPLLPALRLGGIPVGTHVDGLEWQRGKWGPCAQRYYRLAESLAVRWSDALIADARGIADYYRDEFGVSTELISYGAPIVRARAGAVAALSLAPRGYHLVVSRFEPENHLAEIVDGYVRSSTTRTLVVVGDAPYGADYIVKVRAKADNRVRFLGSIWDQDLLDQLYANAFVYWHGHSVGGTNPSLLRAIGAGAPTNAFDVSFNREVLRGSGRFWSGPADVTGLVEEAERDPAAVVQRGSMALAEAARYDWDDVARSYQLLCNRLAEGQLRRTPGATARRGRRKAARS